MNPWASTGVVTVVTIVSGKYKPSQGNTTVGISLPFVDFRRSTLWGLQIFVVMGESKWGGRCWISILNILSSNGLYVFKVLLLYKVTIVIYSLLL